MGVPAPAVLRGAAGPAAALAGGKRPLSLHYHARVTGGKIYHIFLCLLGEMHARELRQDYLHKLLYLINSLGWFSAET